MRIVSVGQILGWEDVINERPFATSVRCLSLTGKLLAIKPNDFIQYIKKDEQMWEMFANIAHNKNSNALCQLTNAKITKSKLKKGSDDLIFNGKTCDNEQTPKENKNYKNLISKYNMRTTQIRLGDFRETLEEIVDIDQYDKSPRDIHELDPGYYGKRIDKN